MVSPQSAQQHALSSSPSDRSSTTAPPEKGPLELTILTFTRKAHKNTELIKLCVLPGIPPGDDALTYPEGPGKITSVTGLNASFVEARSPLLAAAFEPFKAGQRLHLEALCSDTVVPFIRFLYTPSYGPNNGWDDVPTSLLLHCKMYRLGELYDLADLKSQAYVNVLRQCEFGCSSPEKPIDLCKAVGFIYKNPSSHGKITDAIVQYCVTQCLSHKLHQDVEFKGLVFNVNAFNQDLARACRDRGYEDEAAAVIIRMPYKRYADETFASTENPPITGYEDVVHHFHSFDRFDEASSPKKKQRVASTTADREPTSDRERLERKLPLRPATDRPSFAPFSEGEGKQKGRYAGITDTSLTSHGEHQGNATAQSVSGKSRLVDPVILPIRPMVRFSDAPDVLNKSRQHVDLGLHKPVLENDNVTCLACRSQYTRFEDLHSSNLLTGRSMCENCGACLNPPKGEPTFGSFRMPDPSENAGSGAGETYGYNPPRLRPVDAGAATTRGELYSDLMEPKDEVSSLGKQLRSQKFERLPCWKPKKMESLLSLSEIPDATGKAPQVAAGRRITRKRSDSFTGVVDPNSTGPPWAAARATEYTHPTLQPGISPSPIDLNHGVTVQAGGSNGTGAVGGSSTDPKPTHAAQYCPKQLMSPKQEYDAQVQGSTGPNHALQDYQMQLMLLEQQNKKRLLMARREQETMSSPDAPVASTNTFAPTVAKSIGDDYRRSPGDHAVQEPMPSPLSDNRETDVLEGFDFDAFLRDPPNLMGPPSLPPVPVFRDFDNFDDFGDWDAYLRDEHGNYPDVDSTASAPVHNNTHVADHIATAVTAHEGENLAMCEAEADSDALQTTASGNGEEDIDMCESESDTDSDTSWVDVPVGDLGGITFTTTTTTNAPEHDSRRSSSASDSEWDVI